MIDSYRSSTARLTPAMIVLLMLSGCAFFPRSDGARAPRLEQTTDQAAAPQTTGPLSLDQPGEQLRQTRLGRFVIRASKSSAPDAVRGGQGRYEWLHFLTDPGQHRNIQERQVLIWFGPLGQTIGSLERQLPRPEASAPFELGLRRPAIRAFDAEGQALNEAQLQRLLTELLGDEVREFSMRHIQDTLTALMDSMSFMGNPDEGPRIFRWRVRDSEIALHVVPDPS